MAMLMEMTSPEGIHRTIYTLSSPPWLPPQESKSAIHMPAHQGTLATGPSKGNSSAWCSSTWPELEGPWFHHEACSLLPAKRRTVLGSRDNES